uniref:T-cell surface glycoprotein CD3 delta chain n=1 Tax=Neovison vison TaxID=452646 RepID=A0A8C7EL53_NEOVI
MEHCRFLVGLILAVLLSQGSPSKITVEELEDMVFLTCNANIERLEGTLPLPHGKMWNLGKRNLDPRGIYVCNGTDEQDHKRHFTQVYFRTADTQVLLENDQLYQPLRDRNDAQYSHLGENWPRKK